MVWAFVRRAGCVGAMVVALCRMGWAGEPAMAPPPEEPGRSTPAPEAVDLGIDDTDRLYFQFVTGMNWVLDKPFSGDARLDGFPDLILGGSLGYNISRHWGAELQFQGGEPDIRSESRGKIREISIITVVPAVRYRWHLLDGRFVPYFTGGVGMGFTDVNEDAKPFVRADTKSSTVVGSLSSGFDYFLSPNVAVGVEGRYTIHPNQTATVDYQAGPNGRVTHTTGDLNMTGITLLAQLRMFPGQPRDAPGGRTFFLANDGPFDTDEVRPYLGGYFGYDFLFDRSVGGGVKLRDKGGDFNLSKGGVLGVNIDRHWGVEIQMIETPLNLRTSSIDKIAEVDVTSILPTVRWRWPFLNGRLVPFLTAGVGWSYLIVNDPRVVVEVPNGRGGSKEVRSPKWDPQSPRFAWSAGAGVEYFLNHHLSVGVYMPFQLYQTSDTTVRFANGTVRKGTADFSGFLTLLQLKAYL
jgi:opacity protein-like surface antigen